MTDVEDARPKLADADRLAEEEDEADSNIPVTERHSTDVFWCLLFVVYLIGMGVISFIGLVNGDPDRLLFATDHQGKLCGGVDLPNKKYITYPRPNEDVLLSGVLTDPTAPVSFFGVCVERCPLAGEYVCTDEGEAAVQKKMGETGQARETVIRSCLDTLLCSDNAISQGCFDTPLDTLNVFFRCLPEYVYEVEELPESGCVRFQNITLVDGSVKSTCVVYREVTKVTREQPTAGNLLFDTFNTYLKWAQALMGDLIKAKDPILIASLGVTLIVGAMYVFSLRCCVGVVVWVSVIGTVLASISFTVFCYLKAGIISSGVLIDAYNSIAASVDSASATIEEKTTQLISPGDGNNTDYGFDLVARNTTELPPAFQASIEYTQEFAYMAYAMTAVSGIILLIVLSLFDRIIKAIEIFEVASKAIAKNTLLIVVPFISLAFFTAVIVTWSILTAYVASAASYNIKELNQTGISISPNTTIAQVNELVDFDYQTIFLCYMFFGLLWILNFLNSVTVMTISGAVLQWFWNSEEVKTAQRSHTPIIKSFWYTIRYHLGTAAFGGLVLAFIQFIRYVAAYVQRKLNDVGQESKVVKILCCCFQCFLRCVQRCIEFITRNSLIWTAMYGTSFCVSTKSSFMAMISNVGLVAMVTFLGDILQRFGQLLITLVAGLSCWILLDMDDSFGIGGEKQLNSFIFPVLVTMFVAWFISAEVLSVYDITVDTILLSYVQDKRLKKFKADHQERANQEMTDFMEKHKLTDDKLIRQASFNTLQ